MVVLPDLPNQQLSSAYALLLVNVWTMSGRYARFPGWPAGNDRKVASASSAFVVQAVRS